jgi:hypothetical protein
MAHEGVSLMVIQRQLGHSNLDITSVYPQGIDGGEIMETIHVRRYLLQRLTTALIDGAAEALLVARSDTLPRASRSAGGRPRSAGRGTGCSA